MFTKGMLNPGVCIYLKNPQETIPWLIFPDRYLVHSLRGLEADLWKTSRFLTLPVSK